MDLLPYHLQARILHEARLKHLVETHGSMEAALVASAQDGAVFDVKKLIEGGADVLADCALPLLAASKGGHVEMVTALLHAGAASSPKAVATALNLAAEQGHLCVVRLLLNLPGLSTEAKSSALLSAVSVHDTSKAIVVELLTAGADVHYWDDASLTQAACNGTDDIVEVLLQAGADVNADDGDPLCQACYQDHPTMVQLLLKAGADVNANDGQPLRVALREGNFDVAVLLLQAGAEMDNPQAALNCASARGHEDLVGAMIATMGAQLDLDEALRGHNHHLGVVEKLLKAGATPTSHMLEEAYRFGQLGVVRAFVKAGAKWATV